ncbi:MAG: hypothetical protein RL158_126 [Bacteroidota bacterium]|jgi:hypothetical protein
MKQNNINTSEIIYRNDLILYKKINFLITNEIEKLDEHKLSILLDAMNLTIIRIKEFETQKSKREMYNY